MIVSQSLVITFGDSNSIFSFEPSISQWNKSNNNTNRNIKHWWIEFGKSLALRSAFYIQAFNCTVNRCHKSYTIIYSVALKYDDNIFYSFIGQNMIQKFGAKWRKWNWRRLENWNVIRWIRIKWYINYQNVNILLGR